MKEAIERVEKPWGYEIIWARTDEYCGKVLIVQAGHALSLQYHERKDETIYLRSGNAAIEIGGVSHIFAPGAAYRIAPGTEHRLIANTDCEFYEVSTPHLDDVVRVADRYGRGTARDHASRPTLAS